MVVKDNHPALRKRIALFFESACLFEAQFDTVTDHDKGHGRIETRTLTASADVPAGYTSFPGVRQLFRLDRRTVLMRTGEVREDTVYGMTSLSRDKAEAVRLLRLTRGHWAIENRSHWVRDVTFDEDRSQVRQGNIPQVLAAIRNLAIGLIRLAGHTSVARACRRHAAQPQEALALMGIARTE
jgi:hypothetical protein